MAFEETWHALPLKLDTRRRREHTREMPRISGKVKQSLDSPLECSSSSSCFSPGHGRQIEMQGKLAALEDRSRHPL